MENIASHLEHTMLKPDLSMTDMAENLRFALNNGVATFVVPPAMLPFCRKEIDSAAGKIALCTVIGFPLGYNTLAVKMAEIRDAIKTGADEVDVVVNNIYVKNLMFEEIQREFDGYREAAGDTVVKVILETSLLDLKTIEKLTEMLIKAKINYVKTSTGFVGAGAQLDHIKTLKQKFDGQIMIKASGGIKNYEQTEAFVAGGADKIGTSSSRVILGMEEDKSGNTSGY